MVLVLAPLHKNTTSNVLFQRTNPSLEQALKRVQQLENEYAGVQGEMAYKYPIHRKRFHNVTLLKMDIPKKR
jgi:aspartate-semialdehyde dehydrogenase